MSTDTPFPGADSRYREIPGERLGHFKSSVPYSSVPLFIEHIRITSGQSLRAIPQFAHHVLGTVTAGRAEGYYRLKGSTDPHTIALDPGTSYLIEGRAHGKWGWSTSDCTMLVVYVPPAMIHEVVAMHGLDPAYGMLHTEVIGNDRMLHLIVQSLQQIINEEADAPSVRPLVQSVTRALTLRMLMKRRRTQAGPLLLEEARGPLSAPARRRIQTYIEQHLDRDITVADMAECVDMSPSYFSRLFKETAGETPYQYVLQQRLRQAQHLLSTTDLPIAEIALRVGFANQSHLTRRFRKNTHTTPAAYRQAVRLGHWERQEDA